MSFYDSASLAFLPSGGAGKDGKAYSIKPVPEYGNELVTNGDFATDSDWTKGAGWTIANGEATNDGTINAIYQSSSIEAGKKYICKIDITFHSAGVAYWRLGNSSNIGVMSVSGSIEQTLTGSANGTYLGIFTNTAITIDNVSVREVIEADGDFTFSRGSNLTATRVDSNGLIEKGRENLLLQSNNFGDTAWVQSQTSRSSGQEGYDGSNDAWEVTRASGGSLVFLQSISTSGVNTFSVYVKVNASNGFGIRFGSSSYAYFDISDTTKNAAAATNSIVTSSQTYIGNNFYRLSVTASGSFSEVRLVNCTADGTLADSLGFTHIIQDAQVEIGLVATEYIESGATTGKAGLLENEPRFDYSGGATCPSLLLEPQRVQLVQYSEYLNGLNKIGTTITTNETTSPEGIENANKITANGVSGDHQLYTQSISFTSGTSYSISIFAKADTNNFIQFVTHGGTFSNNAWANFDLSNGTTGTIGSDATASMEDYGNGWYRCILTATATATISSSISLFMITSATAIRGESNALSTSSFLYGFQVEAGSYPTSYIPNHSGGSVTRNADGQTLDITNLISSTEGTLFFHLKDAKSHSQTNKILGIGDGSGVDNFFGLYVNDFQTGAVGIRNRQANADLMNTAIPNPQNAKVAIKFSPSGVKTFLNGLEFQSSATAYTGWATSFDLNTTVGDVDLKQYLLFNEALTDKEAVDLTSPYSTYQELVTAEGLTWESPTCTTNSITELQSI